MNKKPTTRHQPLKKIPYIYHVETLITYYPFGLKHEYYNTQERKVKYKEQNTSKRTIKQALTDEVKFKYYFQEQERQDELGLNWDSFKYRNYDYAIARFMSIDPLAEKYPYNSTYAFQENKMGLGRELEGKEIDVFSWLANDIAKNPNGVSAHAVGFTSGVINSVKGAYNAVTHPVETLKETGNMAVAAFAGSNPATTLTIDSKLGTNSFNTSISTTESVTKGVDNLINGNGLERGEVLGEVAGTIALTKGAGEVIEGASALVKANSKVTVYRVFGGDAKPCGYSWTPKDPRTIPNFRDVAGLPSGGASGSINTAKGLLEGTVKNKNIIMKRAAIPLDGNKGGLPEYKINPNNVKIKSVTKINID